MRKNTICPDGSHAALAPGIKHTVRAACWIQESDLRVVEAGAGGHDREQHLPAGKQRWPPVTDFALARIGIRENGRRSAVGGDDRQADNRSSQNDPARRPRSRLDRRARCTRERVAADGRDLVDLRVANEPYPCPVRRNERPARALGAGDRRRLERIEPPQEEAGLTLDLRLVDDETSVGASGTFETFMTSGGGSIENRMGGSQRCRRAALNQPSSRRSRRRRSRAASRRRREKPWRPPGRVLLRSTARLSSCCQIGDDQAGVGDIVQPVLRIALEAAPQQAPQIVAACRPAVASSRSPAAARPRACPRSSRPRTAGGRSASRRARHRRPRCRRACPPPCPRACSGAMYAAVPRIMPSCVAGRRSVGEFIAVGAELAAAGSSAFARPKSSTFTVAVGGQLDVGRLQIAMDDPVLVRGLERRRRSGARSPAPRRSESAPRAIRSASVGASTSSMTSAALPARSSKP